MIHISLFSGIGGFELAAEWMGWRNWVSCDINEFGNKVRHYYWPEGYCHKDVKTLTYETINHELSARFGHEWRDDDIILTGGFPCQPYSAAGKRLGKEDERHLWPEMLRVISEVKPTYIVGENVRGLTNWNGGVVFEEVCADLENLGYEVQPVLLPACAVGAPHRRDRIWFVAYRESIRISISKLGESQSKQQIQTGGHIDGFEDLGNASDSDKRSTGPSRKSGCVESNGSDGHLFTEQRRESSELNNRLYEFSRNAADTNSDGQHQCDSQHEINPSEGGQHALGDLEPSHGDGDAANTKCEGLFGSNETRGTNFINRENSKIWGNSSGYNQKNNRDAADTDSGRQQTNNTMRKSKESDFTTRFVSENISADTCDKGLQGSKVNGGSERFRKNGNEQPARCVPPNWENFPTQSPICGGDDGLPTRLDSITFSKWRNESIKAYGNAIVPQVAYQIFKALINK